MFYIFAFLTNKKYNALTALLDSYFDELGPYMQL